MIKRIAVLVCAACLCVPASISARDKGTTFKDVQDAVRGNRAQDPPPAKSKPASPPKLYRYKGQKKGGLGDGQAMVLIVEDMHTGRSENLFVPNTDPESGKYDPVSSVATVVNELAEGAPIEVQTQRQKGRVVVSSIAKANIAPGEELTNHYVLVAWDKQKAVDGKPIMGVKLRKFGREVTLQVPLTKNKETDDWAAPWGIEHVLGKVQPGGVVEAKIKQGKPPILQDLMLYRPPERGKFVEMTRSEVNDAQVIAFKMAQSDGITLTVTLPGKPAVENGQKVLMPDPKQLATVQKLKPDTEIEVLLVPGDEYILRELRVINPPPKSPGEPKQTKAEAKAGK